MTPNVTERTAESSAAAATRPSPAPAAGATTTLVITSRTIAPAPAPSATRMPSSRLRPAISCPTTPGTAATNPLIVYQQSDADIVSSGGEWRAQWNAAGIWTITPA